MSEEFCALKSIFNFYVSRKPDLMHTVGQAGTIDTTLFLPAALWKGSHMQIFNQHLLLFMWKNLTSC